MILIPTAGPEDWKRFLAQPERQWRDGFSAKAMAERWESARGVPAEVAAAFSSEPELLLAVPEKKTPLPGGGRETQSDLWALLRVHGRTVSMTVEGKVDEPFGPTVAEWLVDASDGKRTRFAFLCKTLGRSEQLGMGLRYQLLHRTAAALIEAVRFKTDEAAMVVHSFSPTSRWREDFVAFAGSLAPGCDAGKPVRTTAPDGRPVTLAWAAA